MERFFGGPVGPTLVRLAILCVLVGLGLTVFGIRPVDLWNDFMATIEHVWSLGGNILNWSVSYFLLGAVIVIPIWLATRVWAVMTKPAPDKDDEKQP